MTFASTVDAERARATLNGSIVGGRKIEVNNATARVQNKKPANSLNGGLATSLTNKNIAASLMAAGLNPSSLPALMNLNRLAGLGVLGNLVAAAQQPGLVKSNLNANLGANLNASLTGGLSAANLTNPSTVLSNDYANTIAQLSGSLNGFNGANVASLPPNLVASLPAGLASNLANNPLLNGNLNSNLVNLLATAAITGQNEQLNNFVQSQQQQPSNASSMVQAPTSNKFSASPSNLLALNAAVAGNTNSNPIQLSPNSSTASNVCSANSYLNNLINNQLLAQLAQQQPAANLHYAATSSAANSQNNHAVTTVSSNLSLNLPSGKHSFFQFPEPSCHIFDANKVTNNLTVSKS